MTFEPADELERFDVNAFGPAEAERRRAARAGAQDAVSVRTVAASDLEPGMVPAVPGGVAIATVCADLEPPHAVRYWLEGDAELAYVLDADEAVEIAL